MRIITVGRKALAEVETGRAIRDHIEQRRGNDRAENLRDHIRQDLAGRKATAGGKTNRHGGIEMATRHMADRVGHRDHAQAERERHADQADADLRKARGDDGAAATGKSEPKGSDGLSGVFFAVHWSPPRVVF
jgi:hypothetical protein